MFRRTKGQIINGAICGILMLSSLLFFMLYGIFAHVWHPTWVVIPSAALVCGIITIIVNTYANLHKNDDSKNKKEEK